MGKNTKWFFYFFQIFVDNPLEKNTYAFQWSTFLISMSWSMSSLLCTLSSQLNRNPSWPLCAYGTPKVLCPNEQINSFLRLSTRIYDFVLIVTFRHHVIVRDEYSTYIKTSNMKNDLSIFFLRKYLIYIAGRYWTLRPVGSSK